MNCPHELHFGAVHPNSKGLEQPAYLRSQWEVDYHMGATSTDGVDAQAEAAVGS